MDILDAVSSIYIYDYTIHTLTYKPVTKKVKLVLAPVDEKFQVTQLLLDNPLAGMIPLPIHPPDFISRMTLQTSYCYGWSR